MSYSKFLKSRKQACKKLVNILMNEYQYVSILGTHITGKNVTTDLRTTNISDAQDEQCGFVIKVYNKNHYSEYSCNDIKEEEVQNLAQRVIEQLKLDNKLTINCVDAKLIEEQELVKSFSRNKEGKIYSLKEIVEKLNNIKQKIATSSELVINARSSYSDTQISKSFISSKKDLEQFYTWTNCMGMVMVRKGQNIKYSYNSFDGINEEECFDKLEKDVPNIVKLGVELLDAKPVVPGVYDIITDPSITGLIAHEAFGHGVEMDMFVKNRALAKDYINKEVASSLVQMHDGAQASQNVASYFFDDDGVLAGDTLIIKDGVLQTGISDCLSALQLGTKPSGNGRRESFKRKAYSRMTNTFFSPGKDKLEDMIKSIEHGYFIVNTSNGMEDPKNWGIQCVAQYGREIKNGQFTGNIIAPVVMSGYVPDLLKSITMVSDQFELHGGGQCGKGYKEWVRVSDGGPHLKAKVKLG